MLTSQKILNYIKKNSNASGKELVEFLGVISSRAVRKQLKNLLEKGLLSKSGRPPVVYYSLADKKTLFKLFGIDKKILHVIENRYLFISPFGEAKYGWDGFRLWCEKTKQDPIKTATEYVKTLKKFDRFRKGNFISGMEKMRHTFDKVFLDKLFYLDFYSIERFGKTKLGQMLLYAKQSQDKILIYKIVEEIRQRIELVIRKYEVDGVLFIPPTVKRETQFMKELENGLNLSIKTLAVSKLKTEIIIPQKTLNKLEDRIENAKRTIIVNDTSTYKNILLIDDAVGSGSTLNETAKQIKRKGICKGRIIGLSITGSFKGFDVISEV